MHVIFTPNTIEFRSHQDSFSIVKLERSRPGRPRLACRRDDDSPESTVAQGQNSIGSTAFEPEQPSSAGPLPNAQYSGGSRYARDEDRLPAAKTVT
jgi:hypothetical protein